MLATHSLQEYMESAVIMLQHFVIMPLNHKFIILNGNILNEANLFPTHTLKFHS